MKKEEIIEELEKLNIDFETDANKPVLKALLDDARLDAVTDDPEEGDPEETEEIANNLSHARTVLSDGPGMIQKVKDDMVKAAGYVSKHSPGMKQASLSSCISQFHDSVRADMRAKAKAKAGIVDKDDEDEDEKNDD